MTKNALSPFTLLADASTYVSSPGDLREDAEDRSYWVALFKRHVSTTLKLAIDAGLARGEDKADLDQRAQMCHAIYDERFDRFMTNSRAEPQRVTIMTLDRWRDSILRQHGFLDPFIDL